jgi:hypothetical protein
MSKEFIEKAYNAKSINKASTQEAQLSYILTSKLQDNSLSNEYINSWANRKYQTNDYFLNWVKMIFKTENFLSFFKYLRYPLPSSKVVKNRIDPQLRRVFQAEDSDFKYDVRGKEDSDFIGELKIKQFNKEIFERLLYNHNSLLVEDLDSEEANKPYRYFVEIDKVKSILQKGNKIWKIAFRGCIVSEDGETIDGTIYIDDVSYQFYNEKHELIRTATHDLGYTPVHFISPNKFDNDFVIRESLYTYIREEIEEYNFLKTLQKMTNAGGAIPVVSKIEVDEEIEDSRGTDGEPSSDDIMGSAKAEVYSQNESIGTGDLQPGTVHEVPVSAIRREDGTLDMAAVQNFLNFHFIPIEALDYLNKRVNELEISIVSSIVGDFLEGNEAAKNRDQVEKGLTILENTLTSLAETLNRIRTKSDFTMLALKYGVDLVNEVFIHYGTDFFLDSTTKLFEDLEKAPNTLERKNIIVRINQNRYKNNLDQLSRQKLLYDLIPYVSDKDFESAQTMQIVSDTNKEYQVRFNYWIGKFEAIYGDIVTFFKGIEGTTAEKLKHINDLILILIKEEQNEDSSLAKDS